MTRKKKLSRRIVTLILFACATVKFAPASFSQVEAAKTAPRTLNIVTTEWPPFEYSSGEKVLGTDVAIAEEAFKRIAVPIKINVLPWARSVKNTQTGVADAIFTLRKTPDRESFLAFPEEPLSVSENVFFRKKDSKYKIQTENDLKDRLVGAVIGYDYGRDFATSAAFRRDLNRSDEKAFDKLAAGRLDFFICDRVVGNFVLSKSPYLGKVVHDRMVYSKFDMFLAFAKKKDLVVTMKDFSRALQSMKKDGSYEKIIKQAESIAGVKTQE